MENTAGKIFTELKEDISTYARLKLRLLKLMAIKTPLGQVILEKREIRRLCQETEEKISADWQYIRSHAGRLMWSEISAVLMPHRRNNGEKQGGPGFAGNPWINMAWQLGKPILYRWMGEVGWQVFKSMFCRRRAE